MGAFALAAVLAGSGCDRAAPEEGFTVRGRTMGTSFTVRVPDPPEGLGAGALGAELRRTLEVVNQRFSTWREDSELSRFNRHPGTEWFAVSAGTAEVVRDALRFAEWSGGAFDPTVAPLLELWGFGPGGPPPGTPRAVPPDEELGRALELVGPGGVEVRRDPPALRKRRAGVRLELSAIAKGHGVDRLGEVLDAAGCPAWFVEIGGEVRVKGEKRPGRPWRVGVERPRAGGDRAVSTVVELRDGALATSGDYRNRFEVDGVVYSHTMDPRSGRPARHDGASVTVAAPTCREADALATALLVLGPEEGLAKARREDIPAIFFLRKEGGSLQSRATPAWTDLRQRGVARSPGDPSR